jgi:hypothetical protein
MAHWNTQQRLRPKLALGIFLFFIGCVGSREGITQPVGKAHTWDDGLRYLIFKTVYPLAKETIRISVGEFKDAATDRKTAVSDLLESDLKTLLADEDGIIPGKGLPVETPTAYLLSGVYVLAGDTLRIDATLQSSTGQIVSTGSILIHLEPIDIEDRPEVESGHPRAIQPPIPPKPPESPIDIIGVPGRKSPATHMDSR